MNCHKFSFLGFVFISLLSSLFIKDICYRIMLVDPTISLVDGRACLSPRLSTPAGRRLVKAAQRIHGVVALLAVVLALQYSDKLDVAEGWCLMEASLVRRAPPTKLLIRTGLSIAHDPKEVHAPLSALSLTLAETEQLERNLCVRHPRLCLLVERSLHRNHAIVVDVGSLERRTLLAGLAGVVDPGVELDVVGSDFELEIAGGVVGAEGDEGLLDFVVEDGAVGGQRLVVVEVGLVVGSEVDVEEVVVVAQVDLGAWEVLEIWDGLVVGDVALAGASVNVETRHGQSGSHGAGESESENLLETHLDVDGVRCLYRVLKVCGWLRVLDLCMLPQMIV